MTDGPTPQLSGGVVATIIAAIGTVLLAPLFKIIFDRMAAGDRAWEARVKSIEERNAKLEDRNSKLESEIAEMRGQFKQLTEMLNQRDITIATMNLAVRERDIKIANLEQQIAEQDMLNERLITRLKVYEPDFTSGT